MCVWKMKIHQSVRTKTYHPNVNVCVSESVITLKQVQGQGRDRTGQSRGGTGQDGTGHGKYIEYRRKGQGKGAKGQRNRC